MLGHLFGAIPALGASAWRAVHQRAALGYAAPRPLQDSARTGSRTPVPAALQAAKLRHHSDEIKEAHYAPQMKRPDAYYPAPELPKELVLRMQKARLLTADVLQAQGHSLSTSLKDCRILPNGMRSYCSSTSYCPRCISARAYNQRTWLLGKVFHPIPPAYLGWLHITTVVPDCPPEELRQRALRVNTMTRRLLTHAVMAPHLRASFSALETPPNRERSDLLHPHVHTIAAVNRRVQDQLCGGVLRDVWNSLPGTTTLDVRPIERSHEGFASAGCYVTKQADYDHPAHSFLDGWEERLADPDRFITEVQQLYKVDRFYGSLAFPKTVNQRNAWSAPWITVVLQRAREELLSAQA